MTDRFLLVHIYRDASAGGDCTNNGVTSPARAPRGLALLAGVPGAPCQDRGDLPVLEIVRKRFRGEEYLIAIPRGETRHVMFGGNYIDTSDARFRAIHGSPIPVHDRIEDPRDWNQD